MTENEKLLLDALEQLQRTHSATVAALNARMEKLENACVALADNQQQQAELLRSLQDERQGLAQLSSELGHTLDAFRKLR